MDRKKLMDAALKAAAGLGLILTGIVLAFAMPQGDEALAVLLYIVNAAVILGIYFINRFINTALLKDSIRAAVSDIKNIFDQSAPERHAADGEFAELFTEIKRLKSTIVEKDKNREDIFNIVSSAATNMDLHSMLTDMLPKIIEVTDSNCGAFYMANHATNKLEIKHSIGFSKNVFKEFDINLGEGLVGDISGDKIKIIKDIPGDTVYIARTFLGNIRPKSIMVVPVSNKGAVAGVLVLTNVKDYTAVNYEQAELIQHHLGIAIGNGLAYETNERLTSELKFQNKLIQDFNTELENKVSQRTILFDKILDSIKGYAIFSLDRDGYLTSWNKGAEELFGYKASEVLGKHANMIYPEEDVKNGLVQRRISIARKEGVYNESLWRNNKDGEKFYAEVSLYSIIGENGELIGYTNVTKDITDIRSLQESLVIERQFSYKMLSYFDNPIMIIDKFSNIKYANAKAAELFSMSSKELARSNALDLVFEEKKLLASVEETITSSVITELKAAEILSNKTRVSIKILPIQEKLNGIHAILMINEAKS